MEFAMTIPSTQHDGGAGAGYPEPHPPLTANQLRWLAERADGTRGVEQAFAWDGEEPTLVPLSDARAQNAPFHVRTEFEGDGLRADVQVEIVYKGKRFALDPSIDTVFLTQSAIDKFVLPYYTRFKTPNEIGALKLKLFRAGAIVATHVPPSITESVGYP